MYWINNIDISNGSQSGESSLKKAWKKKKEERDMFLPTGIFMCSVTVLHFETVNKHNMGVNQCVV